MGKAISLLRFQLKVLSFYFKNPKWDSKKFKEFFSYLLYYSMNWWYYLALSTIEGFALRNKPIKEIDDNLTELYKVDNQFWISLKEGYSIKNEKIGNLTYGETSYLAIKKSLDFIKLSPKDVFYDLGCGTGKTVFFANSEYGAEAIGVDLISEFINKANQVISNLRLQKISFLKKSIFDLSFNRGTVFYITPTCFDRDNLQRLVLKFKTLPKGSRLIVLSIPLNLPNLKPLGQKKLFYSWGMAETFYYEVI